MEKREVFVPLMSWLIGGSRIGGSYNTYTGSLGTDPLKGAIGQRIFNYRILIEKNEEDTEFVRTNIYYGMLSFDSRNEDDIESNIFELSEEGLENVKAYLQSKADEFFSVG
ncbi:MAG: hypothetical protein E7544_02430 [Ruminococcaceae bacterium]|nr:hypothetical protein [Oscillospiraceae bacterium]